MKRYFLNLRNIAGVFLLMVFTASAIDGYCQNSTVTLFDLKIMDVHNTENQTLDKLMIEFQASDATKLEHIEIILEDAINPAATIIEVIAIEHINGVPHLRFPKYNAPFQGNTIRFSLPVRDQLMEPHHRVSIRAFDIHNKDTNLVIFNRSN